MRNKDQRTWDCYVAVTSAIAMSINFVWLNVNENLTDIYDHES